MNNQDLIDRIRRLGEQKSILTEAEVLELGADRRAIDNLVSSGILYPSATGIYMPDNADFGERHSEVEVAARFPDTVVCLATALNFHELTTQIPHEVWISYSPEREKPIEPKLPIYAIPMKKPGFGRGIEIHILEGIVVKIYSQAKTVADCFNYQEYIGIDVAQEAFEQAIAQKKLEIPEILKYVDLDGLNSYTRRDLVRCIENKKKGKILI